MLGIRGVCRRALPLSSSDWITLASGSALWALALYIPLSGPLGRLEAELSGTGHDGFNQVQQVFKHGFFVTLITFEGRLLSNRFP